MTGTSWIAAAQARNLVQERERQLLLFAFSRQTTASDSGQWQLKARSCRTACNPEWHQTRLKPTVPGVTNTFRRQRQVQTELGHSSDGRELALFVRNGISSTDTSCRQMWLWLRATNSW